MNHASEQGKFVVVEPARTSCDYFARVLDQYGLLRLLTIGTRRGVAGVRPEVTRLNPLIGLVGFIGARVLPPFQGEALRARLFRWSDRWSRKQLQPGDHLLSSYGYANECFAFARRHGGKTFLDAGNSHYEHFWEIISQEHERWGCRYPPIPRHWYERGCAMLSNVDYALSPSSYVTGSFLARGFKQEQILSNVYPVDLSLFRPREEPRAANAPLTVINTGNLSLRKGTPYLLEAFRLVRRQQSAARLLLTDLVREDARPILTKYSDLPIEWAPNLPPEQLAQRLRSADVFVMLSLEEGLVRTALEAMACGLQVVLTPNTGASDFVQPGVNGEVVPIRDPQATADAILKCWKRVRSGARAPIGNLAQRLSFETFAQTFLAQLTELGLKT